MSKRNKIVVSFIIICFAWGSSWAAVKLTIETVPVLLSLGLRFSIASCILGLIIVIKGLSIPADKNFWKLVMILCSTSFTVPIILIYWAQMKVNSGLASVLFASFPFWVTIISHKLLPKERITIVRIAGMIIGFIGIILIFKNSILNIEIYQAICMIAIIVGASIQASGLIALRKYGEQIHPVMLNFWSMFISAIILFSISIVIEDYSKTVFDYKTVGSLIYLAIFCTVFAFVLYYWLVKHVEVVILSLSAFITPVIAVVIGVVFMGEELTSNLYAGSSLVLIGVATATVGDLIKMYRSSQGKGIIKIR